MTRDEAIEAIKQSLLLAEQHDCPTYDELASAAYDAAAPAIRKAERERCARLAAQGYDYGLASAIRALRDEP